MCSLAAWTGLIRSITLIFSAIPLSPDHMVLSDRGMALGRWRPTVVADTGGPSLMRRAPPTTTRRDDDLQRYQGPPMTLTGRYMFLSNLP
jgi:hypothetical protein